ncbi:hypothetical protein RVR_10567 [Actinacidiphila reveromycinica]|uniref:Uncharacterized protein n=1 Tax=Actinacidiphila reveromycinica TaxID=659352 RepID=A0A7U3UUP8_9ACTN|nr:hypothetical protein [Streptomyces sp. SN-593]BBB00568.1 hypothetical protein RVR_7696 [Streptomyces sp. SN-593]BBB00621.1 hypothetical protein RVR_10567 [Streptomyces sp. SN-593]
MALNPAYPVVETAWGPYWTCSGGEIPPDRYVDVGGRTLGQFTAQRGRQYELDQVQAGTSTLPLSNTDGALDPTNAAGPYAGHVLPFQPVRRRAQWPPTPNLLNQAQATGGDVGGQPLGALSTADDGPRILTGTDPVGGQLVASGTAWQGGTVIAMAVPAGAAAGAWVCYTAQPAVRPGQTYTVQLRVRNVSPGTSVQVAAGFRTLTVEDAAATTAAGTTATLTGSATAAWTYIEVTATADPASSGLQVGVQLAAAAAAACTVQVDGWQLEAGAATDWVQPGVWYPIMAQFTEDWPAQWTNGGTYGTVTPTGVDALALLSQVTLDDPLSAEIKSHAPRFVYKLDDPSGSAAVADSAGNCQPVPVANSKYGPSPITFGTEITAADTVNGIFTGAPGPVATFTNPNPGQSIFGSACTYLSLTQAGITGPADPTAAWTRMVAFRYPYGTPAGAAEIWMAADNRRANNILAGALLILAINDSGEFGAATGGTGGQNLQMFPPLGNVADGNWHLGFVGHDPDTATMWVGVDSASWEWNVTADQVPTPGSLTMDSIGAFVDEKARYTYAHFAGDLAFACEFPVSLSVTAQEDLYRSWKNSLTGESTDERYARILRYAGYTGPSDLQTGQTTAMGPADFGGQDAVTAAQGVVDTEGGAHYVDGAGTVAFRARSARYNATTPAFVFGERLEADEYPYEDCQPDYDSTHLGNVVQVTQTGTGQVFTATDPASIAAYFPRTITRDVNAADPNECQDAASYIRSRYKDPAMRIGTLRLHPSAHPALWPVCLTLEQGTRVRVMRRPLGAPAITLEQFVENLNWTMDDRGEAVLVLQTSPADTTPYGVISAWHTTLALPAAAGATSLTITPGQTCASLLPPHYTLWLAPELGLGTPGREAVSVLHQVGDVITLNSPLQHSYAAGESVTEALPDDTATPEQWDGSSTFDSTAFTY